MRIVLPVIASAALIAGCSTSGSRTNLQNGEFEAVASASQGGLPPPGRTDLFSDVPRYQIGPFDKLSIVVFGIEELSRQVQADANGRVSLPLAGVIDASGKTPQELELEIETRLRDRYVREPQVTVNLVETVSQVMTVDGEVRQPGLYPVVGRMTLMRAIATARGTTEFARQGNILIFRQVSGQRLVGLYNLRAIRQGLYQYPEIYPNDVIVVDEARARRLFRDFLQIAPLLTAPLVTVLQRPTN